MNKNKKIPVLLGRLSPTATTLEASLDAVYDANPLSRDTRRLAALLLISVDTAWTLDDKVWFEIHQNRSHRLRRLFQDEAQATLLPALSHVLICQVQPGQREKRFVGDDAGGEALDDLHDDELVLMALWRRLEPGAGGFMLSQVLTDAELVRSISGPDQEVQ